MAVPTFEKELGVKSGAHLFFVHNIIYLTLIICKVGGLARSGLAPAFVECSDMPDTVRANEIFQNLALLWHRVGIIIVGT